MTIEVETQTFEQKVTSIVSNLTSDEAGNLVIPEDLNLDEATKFAVVTEKRRRDTQSAYSKAQQRLRVLEAENNTAWETLEAEMSVDLSLEDKTELEELKNVDLDKWRKRLNELESSKKQTVSAKRAAVSAKLSLEDELAVRVEVLKEYNEANPDYQLTDEVIENEIPAKFSKQLEKGEITFTDFITKCSSYLKKGKVLASTQEDPSEVDLSNTPGSSKIPVSALAKSSATDYLTETY